MIENRASVTSVVTAYSRAYHSLNDNPKIFDDFMAVRLFSEEEFQYLGKMMAESLNFLNQAAADSCKDQETALKCVMKFNAPTTISRSRYTEDLLEDSIRNGVSQYIILGAGLDTFAYRRPDLTEKVQVFEVDHPATQENKKERLKMSGIDTPSNLHFIPVDFSRTYLSQALKGTPYDPAKKSFISWLGVSFYLEREVVHSTFRSIASLASSGSYLVFDYINQFVLIPGNASEGSGKMQEIVSRAGEPMKSGFDPSTLALELEQNGLVLIETIGPEEIEKRFFMGRDDGYHASENIHFALAMVK